MKKSFLTFATMALFFGFTSCKETPEEGTEETAVEVMETPEETMEVSEDVVDTTATDVMVEEVDSTSIE